MTEPTRETLPSSSPVLSITSLVLAIAALAVFGPLLVAGVSGVGAVVALLAGVILGVGAVVTGVVARRRVRRGDATGGGVALAGIVLGAAVVAVLGLMLAWLAYILYSDYEDFEHCIRGSGSAYPKYLCLKQCPDFLDSLCRREIGW